MCGCHPELCRTPRDTAQFPFAKQIFRPCGERGLARPGLFAPSERQNSVVSIESQPFSDKSGYHPTFWPHSLSALLVGQAEHGQHVEADHRINDGITIVAGHGHRVLKVSLIGVDLPQTLCSPKPYRDSRRSGVPAGTIRRWGRLAYDSPQICARVNRSASRPTAVDAVRKVRH